MSLLVRDDLSISIPEDLAQQAGIHAGTPVEWERTEDGALKLRATNDRLEAVRRLRGMGKALLKPGESGVEESLKWRQEERELDPTYQQW